MKPSVHPAQRSNSGREALRKRVKQFYLRFNEEKWDECYSLIDHQLIFQKKVELASYSERMRAFKNVYRSAKPWFIRLSLHLDAAATQRDKHPFASVYVI